MDNPFFKNRGPFKISEILDYLNLKIELKNKNYEILDIKDLLNSTHNQITFFHSKKYKDEAKKRKLLFV